MITFSVPSLDPYLSQLQAAPAPLAGLPYDGRRAAVLRGPSGEHIELIETMEPASAPASGDRR